MLVSLSSNAIKMLMTLKEDMELELDSETQNCDWKQLGEDYAIHRLGKIMEVISVPDILMLMYEAGFSKVIVSIRKLFKISSVK